MSLTAWQRLADDLIALDTDGHFEASRRHPRMKKWEKWLGDNPHPVDLMINGGVPKEQFVDRLIQALEEVDDLGDLEWIARALTQKKLVQAVEPLIAAMEQPGIEARLTTVWAIGNALYTIQPRDHLDDFLRIATAKRLDYGRNRVIEHLSRYKKSEQVLDVLTALLEDDSVRGAALEALKRFGDPRAIPAIENTPVREGDDFIYERHQKEMSLRKLRAKL